MLVIMLMLLTYKSCDVTQCSLAIQSTTYSASFTSFQLINTTKQWQIENVQMKYLLYKLIITNIKIDLISSKQCKSMEEKKNL